MTRLIPRAGPTIAYCRANPQLIQVASVPRETYTVLRLNQCEDPVERVSRTEIGVEENSMKLKIFSLVAAVALAMALSSVAKADAIYTLNVGNAGLGGTAPWGTVDVSLSGGIATVTFTAADGNIFFDSNAFSFNTGGTVNSYGLVPCNAGNKNAPCIASITNGGGGAIGDFGTFGYNVNMFDGPTNGVQTFVITILGTWSSAGDVLTANASGYSVEAHICPDGVGCMGGLTGYAAGRSPVPEPGSLALFGTGLLAIAGFLRRRLLA